MSKTKLLICLNVMMVTVLMGCSVTADYDKTRNKSLEVHETIDSNQGSEYFKKVERINRPPVDTRPIKIERKISWLNDQVSIELGQNNKVPLSTVLNRLFVDQPQVKILYGTGVKPSKRVSISARGSREEVLNQLSLVSNYGFVKEDDRVRVMRYIQKTYSVKMPSGLYSGQLGSQGQSNEEGSRIEGQYLNVEYNEVNVFDDIAKGVENILKSNKPAKVNPAQTSSPDSPVPFIDPISQSEQQDIDMEGTVTPIPSMASISVVTTPLLMEQVDEYMAEFDKKLDQQVRLEAQILFFSSDDGKERGIDWNISKMLGDGNSLKFYIPGTNILSPESGYGLAFTGGGDWTGTEAFIRWLDTQGAVSAVVPVTQLALNTQPVRISQVVNVPFVDTISSDASQEIISADVKRDEKVEGIDIMVTPNIQDDTVWLRAAGQYTQIIQTELKEIANTELGFLTTQQVRINFTGKLKFNQSIIIGSASQRINTTDKTVTYNIDALGGNTSQEKIIETLIVLTPRRAG